ncbi:tripartite tricarboxylate transporter substrate binding protein [Achromobacter xylosoxidans]
MNRLQFLKACAAIFALGVAGGGAYAQAAYPDKPVRIIVGYAAGGSADAIARLIGSELSTRLGQPFIVENRPGASGNLAAASVVRSAPDGYVLFLGSNATAINMTLYRNISFDMQRDFAPVGTITSFPNMVVVNPTFPAKTLAELVAYSKANPGKINFASSGAGSSTHLSGELFSAMADMKMTHVPYKGSAPALTDLMSGQVDVMFDNVPSALPFVRAGKLRMLASTGAGRMKALPEAPTVAESGYPEFVVKSWYGLLAPTGTPAEVIAKLNDSINAALASDETKAKLTALGADPEPSTPAQFKTFIASEVQRWGGVVRQTGATVD